MNTVVIPLESRILVKSLEPEEKIGEIYVPKTTKSSICKGTVIAVGKGRQLESGDYEVLNISVGDTVLYGKAFGTDVEIENEKYVILNPKNGDILAILI